MQAGRPHHRLAFRRSRIGIHPILSYIGRASGWRGNFFAIWSFNHGAERLFRVYWQVFMRQCLFLCFSQLHRAIYRTKRKTSAGGMRHIRWGGVGVALTLLATLCPQSRAFADINDLMFPPPAAVGKAIRVDGQGFVLNGKRTFIASGSLHYARVPRALWADRLRRMKRAGFNTVSTYIFWSFQEPRKGDYRFTGRRNLDAFLALVKKMHMYALLRIGPYNNGEWANGGLPNWLRFIPGMLVRSYNQPFLKALKPYFDRLLPIIAKNQITHGGPVVLV